MLKNVVLAVVMVIFTFAGVGCGTLGKVTKVKSVVVKDLPIEQQLALFEKYRGRHAWTRGVMEDMTERVEGGEPRKQVISRDTKVTIIDVNLVYTGTVTVDDPKGKRIVAPLKCERPLTTEKVETRLGELFWFDDPTIRHVSYIRKWGKDAAQRVMNHEVYAGMPAEAARESWGIPDEVKSSEIRGEQEVQWVYKQGKRNKYIFLVRDVVGRWEE